MNEILKKRIEKVPYKKIHPYNMEVNDAYNKGFEDGANFALSHQWINVEEALPEYEEYVLVMHKPMSGVRINPSIAYLHPFLHGKSWCVNGIDCHVNPANPDDNIVYAWMPIPKLKYVQEVIQIIENAVIARLEAEIKYFSKYKSKVFK